MGWACATVAPWALAAGLLVSFTASANQDADPGFSSAVRAGLSSAIDPALLVPPAPRGAGATLGLAWPVHGRIHNAGFTVEDPVAFDPEALGLPPRHALKASAQGFPEVRRGRKGDPLVALRPTFSRRGLDAGIGRGPRLDDPRRIVFSRDERALPPTVMMQGSLELPPPETMTTFEPWAGDGPTLTGPTSAPASPHTGAATEMTYDPSRPPDAIDGGTPSVPRAIALGSTTPAPADATPVEIAAAPVSFPSDGKAGMTAIAKADDALRPHYSALIDPERMSQEQRCLAEVIYFEARSEPEDGQAAVAQVVLNRVRSGLYPKSVCGVVYQNRHRHLACQFTFACEGKSLRIADNSSWKQAVRVAREVTDGTTYLADVGGATHYHADYVRPRWSRKLKKMDVIGRHIFYKLRPGQT